MHSSIQSALLYGFVESSDKFSLIHGLYLSVYKLKFLGYIWSITLYRFTK